MIMDWSAKEVNDDCNESKQKSTRKSAFLVGEYRGFEEWNSTVLMDKGATGKIKVDKSAVGDYSFGIE